MNKLYNFTQIYIDRTLHQLCRRTTRVVNGKTDLTLPQKVTLLYFYGILLVFIFFFKLEVGARLGMRIMLTPMRWVYQLFSL